MSVNNREESPQDMVGLAQELGIIALARTCEPRPDDFIDDLISQTPPLPVRVGAFAKIPIAERN